MPLSLAISTVHWKDSLRRYPQEAARRCQNGSLFKKMSSRMIFEAISDYFDDEVSITTPQRKMTSVPGNARPLVDACYTNAGTVIVDCVLLADGIPDEEILHVEFVDDSDRLHYRYIGS